MKIPRHRELSSPIHARLTRRGVISGGLGLAAASAFAPNAGAATEDMSPVMAKLSAYMSEAGGRAILVKVLEETK